MKKNKKQYVRQDIMLNVSAGDCGGIMEGQLTEVEADDINLKSFEIQDKLNPRFWINGKINSRVRLKLLDLADEFYDSMNIKWVKPKDIVLTGSIANYNWSKYSDVDVHILVDYKDVWKKTDFVKDYFDSKKQLWSEEHDGLKIYGFPVEMYVEDVNNKNPNSGIYSLEKNKWIVEPNDFQDAELNEERIKEISAKLITQIDDVYEDLSKEKDNHKLEILSDKMKRMFDKLVKQRKESLERHGEMGTYNIIWKVLRRSGYLDKIWEIINNVYNKVNSIKESYGKKKNRINEAMDDSFSIKELSHMDSPSDVFWYCREHLGKQIGDGSSRAVFQMDDGRCIKVAYNDYGLQQNKVESKTNKSNFRLFPLIYYSSPNNLFIIMEYVLPATKEDIQQCLGMDTMSFYILIEKMERIKKGKADENSLDVYFRNDKSGTLRDIYEYIINYDIPVGDMTTLGNWGLTVRNGKEHLVLLDSGWNKETMGMYGFSIS